MGCYRCGSPGSGSSRPSCTAPAPRGWPGVSKYPLRKMLGLALDAVTSGKFDSDLFELRSLISDKILKVWLVMFLGFYLISFAGLCLIHESCRQLEKRCVWKKA